MIDAEVFIRDVLVPLFWLDVGMFLLAGLLVLFKWLRDD